jgi:hypothetical protein
LQTLKSKDYLPLEYCVSLHQELTALDERRDELGEEAFHKQLTDAIRKTLDFVNGQDVGASAVGPLQ